MIALQTTERNGATVAAMQVVAEQDLMLISSSGTLVRTPVSEISVVGRNTQGVRLIRLDDGERLAGVERIDILPNTVGLPTVETQDSSELPAGDVPPDSADAAPTH